ncbi:hypothetical protein RI129_000475 [Pyrocoelia pectoralis]|uniref:Uridine diphosphate glucose pyrophosphatase NUDT14 n=1 Tax=Pyrocoelia pectoralis TaxID=417401 RepID=A0AAN7ZVY4_9COLE
MNKLRDVYFKPMKDSIYLKPLTMHFTLNGIHRNWDLLEVHDSVSILIYNITRNVLVFVKQFRPAVYYGRIPSKDKVGKVDVNKYPPELGVTIELCAGIVDKDLSFEEIAREEMLEECGYNVPVSNLKKIASYQTGVGGSSAKQVAFYCEVTDDMKVNDGGGVEDESIEVIEMTVQQVNDYVSREHILSPPSFLFGIHWFFRNKL